MNIILYVFFACVVVVASNPFPRPYQLIACPNCNKEPCAEALVKCYFGTFQNRCGKLDCRKGPGEECDDDRYQLGFCGNGLFCRCNQCSGCSSDIFSCFENENCIADHSFKRAGSIMF